jgi:MerR family regulatory protein
MEHELQSNLIKIGEAANIIGVTTTTLRRWEKQGFLPPTFRSNKRTGGTRFYFLGLRITGRRGEQALLWR